MLSCGGGCPSRFSGSPPLPILQCYGVLLPRRKGPSPPLGRRARRANTGAEGLSLRRAVSFEGRRSLESLQASGRGHASRARPSRGLASRRLAEALASAAQRAWQRRPSGTARSGRRAARRPQPNSYVRRNYLPPTNGRSRTSTVSLRDWEQPCPPSEPRSRSGRRPDFW